MMILHRYRGSGFTLIEMMVVIGIIVLLIGIGLPVYNAIQNRAKIAHTRAMIHRIELALEQYKTDYGCYPQWGEELNNPVTPDQWKIINCLEGYITFDEEDLDTTNNVVIDPWGNYYIVFVDHDSDPTTPSYKNYWGNRSGIYIYSYGPDGKESHDSYDAQENQDNIDNYLRR